METKSVKAISNILTETISVELDFIPGRNFQLRKADLRFDAWCEDNYGTLQNYYDTLLSQSTPKATTFLIIKSFYHLMSPSDQRFLNEIEVEAPLDEDGNEAVYSNIDKLMHAASTKDVGAMVGAILKARGLAQPNKVEGGEKKKKKTIVK